MKLSTKNKIDIKSDFTEVPAVNSVREPKLCSLVWNETAGFKVSCELGTIP